MSSSTMESFDDLAETIPAGGGFGGKDLKNLPDGEYQMQVYEAKAKVTKNGERIFTIVYDVAMPGGSEVQVEHPYFLTKEGAANQITVGILKNDLKAMGFDQDKWTKANNRPFSVELEKAALAMAGVKLKCKKFTNGKYANLQIIERLPDDKPNPFTPEHLEEAAKIVANPFEA